MWNETNLARAIYGTVLATSLVAAFSEDESFSTCTRSCSRAATPQGGRSRARRSWAGFAASCPWSPWLSQSVARSDCRSHGWFGVTALNASFGVVIILLEVVVH